MAACCTKQHEIGNQSVEIAWDRLTIWVWRRQPMRCPLGFAPAINDDPSTFVGRLLMQLRDEVYVSVLHEKRNCIRTHRPVLVALQHFRALCKGKHTCHIGLAFALAR